MGIEYDEKSCGIVVYRREGNERLFLLLHYPSGHWDLVKGHVEGAEEEHETAMRELLEETGIADLEFVEGYREEIAYEYPRENPTSHKQVVFFLGKTEAKDVHISHEHHGFIWLPYNEALEKITFDNAKNLLKKAKNFLEK